MSESMMKDELRTFICEEILRNPNFSLTDDEPLITGGLIDSHSVVEIALFVDDVFDVYIPDTELSVENMDTIDSIVALIQKY